MIGDLKEFKGKIMQKYPITYSRSKILENTHGVIDFLSMKMKQKGNLACILNSNTKRKKTIKRKIGYLEKEIK